MAKSMEPESETGVTEEVEISASEAVDETYDNSDQTNMDIGSMIRLQDQILQKPIPPQERNYTQYYAVDVGGIAGHDHYIYRHPNGLCIVGLAFGHTAFQKGNQIVAVDFEMGKKNRQPIEVTGKSKKNAKFMDTVSALCKVLMADDSFFVVRCCVKASLLEMNYRLSSDITLLIDKAESEGFIAILMPRPVEWEKVETTFLTKEKYKALRQLPENMS